MSDKENIDKPLALITRYLEKMDALQECLVYSDPIIRVVALGRIIEIQDYQRSFLNEDHSAYQVPVEEMSKFQKASSELRKTSNWEPILLRSLFVTLFTLNDAFTADLLSVLWAKRPEMGTFGEKSLRYADIVGFIQSQ